MARTPEHDLLFESIQIGTKTMKNRLRGIRSLRQVAVAGGWLLPSRRKYFVCFKQ
jgi:hypothetical protein